MKRILQSFLKYCLVFIALIILFNVFLYISCSFSSKHVEKNVRESAEILTEEGIYPILSKTFFTINNNCTDIVIMNEAYSIDNKDIITSYMKARRNYKEGLTAKSLEETTGEGTTVYYDEETKKEILTYDPTGELNDFLDGKIHTSINYGRYWHGYLVLYRPLLTIFNISHIRILLLVSYVALLLCFIHLLKKRFSTNIVIIYSLSIICSGYFTASYSLESSPIFLVTMISSIIFLKRLDKIKNIPLFLFVIGCITNYVDFLTVPLLSLGIPCSLYLLKLREQKADWKESVKFLIRCSIAWVSGYALTWLMKWILYDLIIKGEKSMLKIGFEQIFYRTSRTNDAVVHINLLGVIINIISKSSLFILLTTTILMFVNKFKINVTKIDIDTIPFIVLALYPIVWYVALANHTLLHDLFTYRLSVLFMIGILLFINQLFINKGHKKNN